MERVVVVGGGSMGAGIAAVALEAGCDVRIVEPDAGARDRALDRVVGAEMIARVPTDDAVSLAIEAVPERLELKREIFAKLARALPHAVLATNTSSLSVAEIAEAGDPSRTVGLHFFNPPEKMQLVEVVRTRQSSDAAITAAREFVERVGKVSILTADTPGFVVNRVARPYYLQAIRALEAGVADMDALDALARGIGFRMGPFELMDFIGLDVNLATSESVYERTRAPRFEPRAMQRELVARGQFGRKSGAGFYDYDVPPQRLDLRRVARTKRFEPRVGVVADEELTSELVKLGARAGIDGEEDIVVVDAYGMDLEERARSAPRPERVVGVGVVGRLADQAGVEIVASSATSKDALALAVDAFDGVGHGAVRVRNVPGLFLGRVVASIVDEARTVVREGIASGNDVDLAMRLGTNYPRGPIEWGPEIGERRVARILDSIKLTDT